MLATQSFKFTPTHTHTHTNTHTHTHTYIYIYICVCVCVFCKVFYIPQSYKTHNLQAGLHKLRVF